MKVLTIPPHHPDKHVKEALYNMTLEAAIKAEEDFKEYISGNRNILHGDYLYQEDDSKTLTSVYSYTNTGYVFVGYLNKTEEVFLSTLKEIEY